MKKDKKEKPVITDLYDEVYRTTVLFMSGLSADQAKLELEKKDIKDHPIFETLDASNGFTLELRESNHPKVVEGVIYAMWVKDRKGFYDLYHEVIHLATMIFIERGVSINYETTEPFAYYCEAWFRRLWRVMNKDENTIQSK